MATTDLSKVIKLLSTEGYGGVDLFSYAYKTPIGRAQVGTYNVSTNRTLGTMRPVLGRTAFTAGSLGAGSIGAMYKFIRAQSGNTPSPVVIVEYAPPSASAEFYYTLLPQGVSTPWVPITIPATSLSVDKGTFVDFAQWLFFANRDPYAQALKFDDNMNCTGWGIVPPIGIGPILSLNAGPGFTATDVVYAYTYATATQESSINTVIAPLVGPPGTVFTNPPLANAGLNSVSPVNQTVNVDCFISLDPQVTTINIYRIDVANAEFIFVGSIPNTSAYGGAAAGSARYVDSTADTALVGQVLIQHRDPPAPFYDCCSHKGFIFGFGHDAYTTVIDLFNDPGGSINLTTAAGPSDLWYSNYNEPWGFNNVTQVIQVNQNAYGDVAVACRSVGGALVLLKSRSAWVLYGDSPNDFQTPQEIGRNLGCVSKQTAVQALGVLFWLSNQGVFMFDGTNLQNISRDLKNLLDSLQPSDLAAACAGFHDGQYVISFPTVSAYVPTYTYDLELQQWFPLTFSANIFAFDLEDTTQRPGSVDFIIGALNSGQATVSQWFDGPIDFTSLISSQYVTRIWRPEVPAWYVFAYLEIESIYMNGNATSIIVSVQPNPGTPSATGKLFTRSISFENNPSVVIHLPDYCQGSSVQVTIKTQSGQDFEIGEVRLFGYEKRRFVTSDSI